MYTSKNKIRKYRRPKLVQVTMQFLRIEEFTLIKQAIMYSGKYDDTPIEQSLIEIEKEANRFAQSHYTTKTIPLFLKEYCEYVTSGQG